MPTAAAKSEEFYQSTAQGLQKQSRARAAVWLQSRAGEKTGNQQTAQSGQNTLLQGTQKQVQKVKQ
jgi:hypothetical protein